MKSEKIMKPLWLQYPNIVPMDIGWRMGAGESYAMEFHDWYEELSEEDKAEYRELFPVPALWSGFWDPDCECIGFYEDAGEFSVLLWDGDGTPKYNKAEIQKQLSENKKIITFPKYEPENASEKPCFLLSPENEDTAFEWLTDFYDSISEFLETGKAAFKNDEREEEWEELKYSSALNAIWQNYGENIDDNNLLETGDSILVMTDPDDKVWGAGLSWNDPDLADPSKWPGENLYGFALMEVRDEIRRIWKNVGLCTE